MFRANVAALIRCQDKYIACYRMDHKSWQCVQGGIEPTDTSPSNALTRELEEELGVNKNDFKIINQSKFWRRYYFTQDILKNKRFKDNRGQEQLWFLIELHSFDRIHLEKSQGEFARVELFDLPSLLSSYSMWKQAPFYDFCRELGLLNA